MKCEVNCADPSSECLGPMEVDVPFLQLDKTQLALICEGQAFDVRPENLPHGYSLHPEDAEALREHGAFSHDVDYRPICEACTGD
jgi:hypothetical protein